MLMAATDQPGFVLYYPDLEIIDEASNVIARKKLPNYASMHIQERLICLSSAGAIIDNLMLPADFLPRNESVTYPSDLVQSLNLILFGEMIRVPGVYGRWRDHPKNATASFSPLSKAQELKRTVSNWYAENPKVYKTINVTKMNANLFGQVWKLVRRNKGLIHSILEFSQLVNLRYFLNPMFCYQLIRAIYENRKFRRIEILHPLLIT
jgi:hypothetical protein